MHNFLIRFKKKKVKKIPFLKIYYDNIKRIKGKRKRKKLKK